MPPNSGLLKWGWALHFLQRNFYLLIQCIPFNEKDNRNGQNTMTSNTLQSLLLIGMLCFLKGCIYIGCFLLSPLKTINHHLSNISLFIYCFFFSLKFHQRAEGIPSQLVPGPKFPVKRKMQFTSKILPHKDLVLFLAPWVLEAIFCVEANGLKKRGGRLTGIKWFSNLMGISHIEGWLH